MSEKLTVADRITAYLAVGGLFNPELANHDAVRDLLIDARDELLRQPADFDAGIEAAAKHLERAAAIFHKVTPADLRNFAALIRALRPTEQDGQAEQNAAQQEQLSTATNVAGNNEPAVAAPPSEQEAVAAIIAHAKDAALEPRNRLQGVIARLEQLRPARREDGMVPSEVQPIFAELEKAVRKFPTWPTDPLHAVSVLGEEYGELVKEVLQMAYEPHKTTAADIETEARQTAAMAIRFYLSLERYQYKQQEQHSQPMLAAGRQS